jgi:hypothetical protein
MREVIAMIGWARIVKTALVNAFACMVVFLPLVGFCYFVATGKGNSILLVVIPLVLYPVLIVLITLMEVLKFQRDCEVIKSECEDTGAELVSMQARDGGYLVRILDSGNLIETFCVVRKRQITWIDAMDRLHGA